MASGGESGDLPLLQVVVAEMTSERQEALQLVPAVQIVQLCRHSCEWEFGVSNF